MEELTVADAAAWDAWLEGAGAASDGVWLVLAKKGTTDPTSLTYDQALDAALCNGWIDGQLRKGDAATYLQRFTPRRPRSTWSARNVGHVERLAAEGRMRPAGLAQVEAAKADGRWEAAYPGAATATVPDDLQAALDAAPEAAATFAAASGANRYAVLHRVLTARTAATRARRIEAAVAMLARGEVHHPAG